MDFSGWRNHLFLVAVAGLAFCFHSCQKNPDSERRPLHVWLHRVNTISKAQAFQYDYSGFELDVHFDTVAGTFLVKHDFADTSTLTLPTWFSSIDSPSRLGYWLDFKNLDSHNSKPACEELLRIRMQFGLVNEIIVVESSSPPDLAPFNKLNLRTSYYIPTFIADTLTPEEEIYYRDFIVNSLKGTGITTISGYYQQHGFMTKWFPGMNKLLWYLDSYDPAVKDSIIAETKKDPAVEVLLVPENAKDGDH